MICLRAIIYRNVHVPLCVCVHARYAPVKLPLTHKWSLHADKSKTMLLGLSLQLSADRKLVPCLHVSLHPAGSPRLVCFHLSENHAERAE